MSHELTRNRSPLLPDRRPTPDFFVCDILGAAPKGDMASMEHPIFSLSTKPDLRTRRYKHGAVFIEIAPSAKGLATVHDRDIFDLLHFAFDRVIERRQGNYSGGAFQSPRFAEVYESRDEW